MSAIRKAAKGEECTSKMGVRRLASLIEYVGAWAAENGVVFKTPPAVF